MMKANISSGPKKCFCKTFFKNLIKFPVNISRTVVVLNGQMGFASFIDHTCQILNTLVLWPSWMLQSILIYYFFLAGFWASMHKKFRHYLNFPGIKRSYLFLIHRILWPLKYYTMHPMYLQYSIVYLSEIFNSKRQ